ncbi:sugar nucleotide-binding protein [Virgibacillus dakarensis]|uniref:NAD(P)-dependent oxidoreductase n=1 Tax=Lentibacillus populi TaxID=1827502 RepID=A0A9W5TVG0_9BACI|nr:MULTISPECIES: sugar nucleotide-binding protein [Bacillaceae]MTW86106.1 sugar nucleotide-binding protein [Virgibacillus dakarensis]GGB35072.1 NAD(P)-dependent oxidoreductase [Lentibacillus populi]
MKVCVFGANGYVGASVYQQLHHTDTDEVVGTYLQEPAILEGLYKLDVNEPESFSNFYKKENPDVVVWTVMSGPNEHKLTDQGLIHLITHLTPQTKLVYISSDFVFSDGNGPYEEDDPLSNLPDDHSFSNYANGKVKAERLIDNELTNYIILRAGPIYGENGIGKLDERTDQLSYHLRSGNPIEFRDDLIRTFVHIDDLTKAIDVMVHNDVTGVYHVGPEEKQSFYEFMKQMAKQMGYDDRLVKKGSEIEKVDTEIPKNTSLITEKIKDVVSIEFK